MNYRLLISTANTSWEEHFDTLAEAETRIEFLQQKAEEHEIYCNLTLLKTIADITINPIRRNNA